MAAAIAPVTTGHNLDPASVDALGVPDGDLLLVPAWDDAGAVSLNGHMDDDRMGASGDSAGVSGRYVDGGIYMGATGAFFPIEVDSENSLFPDGIEIFAANALCDVEVLGPGSVQAAEDEPMVDSDLNLVWGAIQNEGDWDDGGSGGACHTTGYGRAEYNTPGCPSGASVNAEDAVVGPMIWIGASCDALTVTPGENSAPDPQAFALCMVNEAIQDKDFNRCIVDFLNCVDNAETCGDPSTISCGSDNVADSTTFGRGQGHGPATVTFPLPGVDSNGVPCSTDVGQAIVFTFSGVHANVPDPATGIGPGDVTVSAASVGWAETAVSSGMGNGTKVFGPFEIPKDVPGIGGKKFWIKVTYDILGGTASVEVFEESGDDPKNLDDKDKKLGGGDLKVTLFPPTVEGTITLDLGVLGKFYLYIKWSPPGAPVIEIWKESGKGGDADKNKLNRDGPNKDDKVFPTE